MSNDFGIHLFYWLKQIQDVVPPFCVEIFLQNQRSYFLNSVCYWKDDDPVAVLRVWDLREMTDTDIKSLKEKMNVISERREYANETKIHPKLDWANLRIHKDYIVYVVEWHDRVWPCERIGF